MLLIIAFYFFGSLSAVGLLGGINSSENRHRSAYVQPESGQDIVDILLLWISIIVCSWLAVFFLLGLVINDIKFSKK